MVPNSISVFLIINFSNAVSLFVGHLKPLHKRQELRRQHWNSLNKNHADRPIHFVQQQQEEGPTDEYDQEFLDYLASLYYDEDTTTEDGMEICTNVNKVHFI